MYKNISGDWSWKRQKIRVNAVRPKQGAKSFHSGDQRFWIVPAIPPPTRDKIGQRQTMWQAGRLLWPESCICGQIANIYLQTKKKKKERKWSWESLVISNSQIQDYILKLGAFWMSTFVLLYGYNCLMKNGKCKKITILHWACFRVVSLTSS